MADVSVLAGDFNGAVPGAYVFGSLHLARPGAWSTTDVYVIRNDAVTLEIASEETVTKVGGAIGWGAVGGLVAGPVGLLAGAMLGGKGEKVAFVAEFIDGKKLMAICDKATWTKMLADKFRGPDPKLPPREQRRGASRGGSFALNLIVGLVVLGFLFYGCASLG
jgi:hypothetical protein